MKGNKLFYAYNSGKTGLRLVVDSGGRCALTETKYSRKEGEFHILQESEIHNTKPHPPPLPLRPLQKGEWPINSYLQYTFIFAASFMDAR